MPSATMRRGPGVLADPEAKPEPWGGRKAQEYVRLTLATYGNVCWLCGLPGSTTADHVIPRSLGGATYDINNLGPAHKRCGATTAAATDRPRRSS